MTLSITDTVITSDITDHHCTRFNPNKGWFCTWVTEQRLTTDQAIAAMELAEIVAKGRDDKETTNYAYFTWQRVKELSEVLGVIPLKTVLYLESLSQEGWEGVK